MSQRPTLAWARDGRDWPHRESSSFVEAGGLRWHVQQMGAGPVALLIHGTGAATHSWRGLMPLLAPHFRVVAMDLPGHGFTDTPSPARLSLPGIAAAVSALVRALTLDVDFVVGHSAGAAIGARLVLDGALAPKASDRPAPKASDGLAPKASDGLAPKASDGLALRASDGPAPKASDRSTPKASDGLAPKALGAINGAFLPLAGLPGLLFPPVARLMAATPLTSHLFARRSWDRAAVEKLIGGTGSALDAEGLALYGALVSNARHAAGALGMMARWDLQPLVRDLPRLATPLALVVGANDRAVPPRDAERVRRIVPTSTPCSLDVLPGAGHLVHEERPGEVVERLLAAWQRLTAA